MCQHATRQTFRHSKRREACNVLSATTVRLETIRSDYYNYLKMCAARIRLVQLRSSEKAWFGLSRKISHNSAESSIMSDRYLNEKGTAGAVPFRPVISATYGVTFPNWVDQ